MEQGARTSEQGWVGDLELGFACRDGDTVLARRAHRGPLLIQRPFFPEGRGCCHVYVLHPPGGVVAGDQLTLRASADAGAHALLTTPAATKIYRSGDGRAAAQRQHLRAAAGPASSGCRGRPSCSTGRRSTSRPTSPSPATRPSSAGS